MKLFLGLCLCVGAATALAAWGYASAGYYVAAGILLAVGTGWLVLQSKWLGVASLGFAVLTLAAAAGLLLGFPTWQMGAAALCALAGWDLNAWLGRFRWAGKDAPRLVSIHLVWLAAALTLGAGMAWLARMLRLRLNFELSAPFILLGALVIYLLIIKLAEDRNG